MPFIINLFPEWELLIIRLNYNLIFSIFYNTILFRGERSANQILESTYSIYFANICYCLT